MNIVRVFEVEQTKKEMLLIYSEQIQIQKHMEKGLWRDSAHETWGTFWGRGGTGMFWTGVEHFAGGGGEPRLSSDESPPARALCCENQTSSHSLFGTRTLQHKRRSHFGSSHFGSRPFRLEPWVNLHEVVPSEGKET